MSMERSGLGGLFINSHKTKEKRSRVGGEHQYPCAN